MLFAVFLVCLLAGLLLLFYAILDDFFVAVVLFPLVFIITLVVVLTDILVIPWVYIKTQCTVTSIELLRLLVDFDERLQDIMPLLPVGRVPNLGQGMETNGCSMCCLRQRAGYTNRHEKCPYALLGVGVGSPGHEMAKFQMFFSFFLCNYAHLGPTNMCGNFF